MSCASDQPTCASLAGFHATAIPHTARNCASGASLAAYTHFLQRHSHRLAFPRCLAERIAAHKHALQFSHTGHRRHPLLPAPRIRRRCFSHQLLPGGLVRRLVRRAQCTRAALASAQHAQAPGRKKKQPLQRGSAREPKRIGAEMHAFMPQARLSCLETHKSPLPLTSCGARLRSRHA